MCLNVLNKELKAYKELKKIIEELSSKEKKIVLVVVVCLVFLVSLLLLCKYTCGICPFDLDHYNNALEQFNSHLGQVKRTENGIKELESALGALNKIKEIESKKILFIKGKKAIQLTEDFKRKCDELEMHFNDMRFSDDELVKREGEQRYNAVENIKRQL